ncbi:MAG: hypothetical protein JWP52_339 [Rhizobacter sp.]|nr:hypothetical protein [Rhizobacter sp.]
MREVVAWVGSQSGEQQAPLAAFQFKTHLIVQILRMLGLLEEGSAVVPRGVAGRRWLATMPKLMRRLQADFATRPLDSHLLPPAPSRILRRQPLLR